ncbi:MAG: tetratricopeptide repeat protein [Acidobacteriota bacterium]|nr:tetratricopeptide repeat protein [Acidobacteriota bacterium]
MFTVVLLMSLAVQPLTFQGFFAVFGTVRDEQGQPVSTIRVSIVDENYQPIRTVFSDASGHFQFRSLRASLYYLRVEPAGLPFEEYSERVELYSLTRRNSTTEEATLVDVVLKRKKSRTAPTSTSSGVVFAQAIPPAAREKYDRGASSIKNNDSQSGIAALEKAIEIFPDYFDALELLGTEYVKLRRFESAIPILKHALAINNKAGSSMYALGFAYFNLNRLDESIEWLQNASAHDSNNPNVYMMLGLAYGHKHSWDQAESALKKAYELGRANAADAHLYLAGIYDKKKRYGDAWRELELYLKEAKGLKDTTQIKKMIDKLKAKDTGKEGGR